jgi:hypothetical protein
MLLRGPDHHTVVVVEVVEEVEAEDEAGVMQEGVGEEVVLEQLTIPQKNGIASAKTNAHVS